jgi:hypothetical protein
MPFGNLILPLFAIMAALIGSFLTVYLERKKDEALKLQDRKDLWLDSHWNELWGDLINLAEFNTTRTLRGDDTTGLATQLVSVDLLFNSVNCRYILLKENKENINEKFDNCLAHLRSGYNDIYKFFKKLEGDEINYHDNLQNSMDTIANEMITTMEKLASLKPLDNNQTLEEGCFDFILFLKYLMCHSNTEKCHIIKVEGGGINVGYWYDAIVKCSGCRTRIDESRVAIKMRQKTYESLEKAIDNIESISRDSIMKIRSERSSILNMETEFSNMISDVVKSYEGGHIIEGTCEICGKIYDEKNITKLRPKQ